MASNTNEEDDIDYDEIEQVQETKEDENNYVKKWAPTNSNLILFYLISISYHLPLPPLLQLNRGHYVGMHTSNFRDFILKPELLRAVVDCGFEHPSEG